jgi:hypothetical protein
MLESSVVERPACRQLTSNWHHATPVEGVKLHEGGHPGTTICFAAGAPLAASGRPPSSSLLLLLLLVGLVGLLLLAPALACIARLPAEPSWALRARSCEAPPLLYLEASSASAAWRLALLPAAIEQCRLLRLLRLLDDELTGRQTV